VVLFLGAAGDDVVVEVGEDEGQVAEEHVHEPLEGLGRVPDAKRHEQVFKESKRSYNRRFGYIFWGHWDLVVPFDKVYAREVPAAVEFVGLV